MVDFKNCISQLESNKVIIEKLSKHIVQDQACWKYDDDRWSILEILNHLIDIEIEDFRFNFDLILFKPNNDWPSFNEMEWITSRKYNERELSVSIENFVQEREHSIQWLKTLSKPDLYSKHLGNGLKNNNMHAGDLLASWIGHDLFHIKQITLLKWEILKQWSDPFTPEYSGFYTG